MDLVETLTRSLAERWRPEAVAVAILDASVVDFTPKERTLLERARPYWARSSMPEQFARVVDMAKQCASAARLFGIAAPAQDTDKVRAFILKLRTKLKATKGLDFKADRLTRKQRRRAGGLPKSHRAYNKRFRMLARLEKKFETWGNTSEMSVLARVAKSRLAFRVEKLKDADSACFVAWMAARLNVRSTFTFGKQERAYDEVAAMLLARVPTRGDWYQIALVHPDPAVLSHLTPRKKGMLLGEWSAVMRRAAGVLERVAKRDKPNLTSLIVACGNDSSTWNEAAGAFNKARDGWIATLYALGLDDMLDAMAPGKALRLMAADVAAGHRIHGDGLDPDTRVWDLLPKPWEVMNGTRKCNRAKIAKACAEAGTPHGGWIKPRAQKAVAFKPTPELVHGVVCSDPKLATLLKSAGYFGGHGHPARARVAVARPFDGEKVGAAWSADEL